MLVLVLAGTCPAGAQEAGRQRVLVLKNGGVLEGIVQRGDAGYSIRVTGGEIHVPDRDVELIADDIDIAYRIKASRIDRRNPHAHAELATWCLRQNLTGPAAEQLAEAIAIDPNHPSIPQVQRKLEAHLQQATASQIPVEAPTQPSITNEDLDRMMRAMPADAMQYFTRHVQPMLMNRCLASGCHSARSDAPMPLQQVTNARSFTHRTTQRNVYSLLPYIDRDEPESSRLLKSTLEPHGPGKKAIFLSTDDPGWQMLRYFVYATLQSKDLETPEPVDSIVLPGQPSRSGVVTAGAEVPAEDEVPSIDVNGGVRPAGFDSPSMTPGAGDGSPQPLPRGTLGKPVPKLPREVLPRDVLPGAKEFGGEFVEPVSTGPQRGAKPGFQPKDPFDPEIFNRFYKQKAVGG